MRDFRHFKDQSYQHLLVERTLHPCGAPYNLSQLKNTEDIRQARLEEKISANQETDDSSIISGCC